jgi:toxin ParE1/3/4
MTRRRIQRRLVSRFDALDIVATINAANPVAAGRFVAALRATEELLLERPGIGTPRDYGNPALAGMRWHSVKGFRKYLIFYLPRSDGIEIVRVLHGARDLDAIFRS